MAWWRHMALEWSTLDQVMAWCLTAPSHYLNQCWIIISKVQRHSSEGNFTIDTSAINHNHLPKLSNLPGTNELISFVNANVVLFSTMASTATMLIIMPIYAFKLCIYSHLRVKWIRFVMIKKYQKTYRYIVICYIIFTQFSIITVFHGFTCVII